MTKNQFTAALEALGFTDLSFAATIKVNDRTVRRWIYGESVVPTAVAMLLNLMLKTNSTAEDLKK
jgi:DNA-binding transcriptional regulator YiaG